MKLTKQFMHENKGCYGEGQLNACSFMQLEEITLESILDSEIPLKDKYWFVCKKLATKEQNQRIAIGCAEIVLHLFENKYPDDKRPRKAIQAAKDYLAGTININQLHEARHAAYAAAAYAAAAAAAYAADAYAAAAYAAAAADAADLKQTLLQFLKDFCRDIRN